MSTEEKIKLTEEKIKELAEEILDFLLEHEMWIDVQIYFNGKCWSSHNKEKGTFHYNDKENVVEDEADPRDYFEFVRTPNILSMSFEGPFYKAMNGYLGSWKIEEEFSKILEKYGLYYELGYAWSLTCYET